jgi:hypothetical protein
VASVCDHLAVFLFDNNPPDSILLSCLVFTIEDGGYIVSFTVRMFCHPPYFLSRRSNFHSGFHSATVTYRESLPDHACVLCNRLLDTLLRLSQGNCAAEYPPFGSVIA